jgi:7,8-dihydropterin-6-yl-methyl-4-(beta-D-ribofuranosyl)aminobenzene 5'-phosphate synthase
MKMMEHLMKYTRAGAKIKLLPIWEESQLSKELGRFKQGKLAIEQEWESLAYPKISDLGTTKSLEIIPLIDFFAARKDLKGEPGVSYMVKADENTILFDVGVNLTESDPSPLLQNMQQLGITLDEIDSIVISHNHVDHVGGQKWAKNKSFSLTARQIDLGEKRVYTPVPMTYPRLNPIWAKDPTVIGKGVATTGTISNQLFFDGYTPEQALAVNVEGKGVVLIVGCGHQTLPKIMERTEALFEEPIYGVIGGLHYPVTGGPLDILGMKILKYSGTGKVPWKPITMEEVQKNIQLLKSKNPRVVALSAHDSCKVSLEAFREAFQSAYREIRVGDPIKINN